MSAHECIFVPVDGSLLECACGEIKKAHDCVFTPSPGKIKRDFCVGCGSVRYKDDWIPGRPTDQSVEKVNHPAHYNAGSIEVINVIEDWQLGFHEGNAVKYIARAKHKESERYDIEKAIWYLQRLLQKEKCESCDGSGKGSNDEQDCFDCNGTGEMCDVCGEAINACLCDDADIGK